MAIEPRTEARVRESFARQGAMSTFGARVAAVREGEVEIELPFSFVEGPIVDALVARARKPEEARRRIARDIPLGRFGAATEVADLCVDLLSDEARLVTGAEFTIDGGLTAG